MAIFKSSNPALSEKRFVQQTAGPDLLNIDLTQTMTIRGTIQKFGFLMLMVLGAAFYSWKEAAESGSAVGLMITGGVIGGFVLAMVIIFKQSWAPYIAPLYALCQGFFLGAISSLLNTAFAEKAPNIIPQAVGLTMGTAVAMYLLYSFRIIKATEKFKSVIIGATLGIAVFYLITWVLRMFGVETMTFIHEGSALGIVFCLFVTVIAALNLILDFDMIEKGQANGAPKYMEWYGAFGLLVTIVWLYIEILRLLSILNRR